MKDKSQHGTSKSSFNTYLQSNTPFLSSSSYKVPGTAGICSPIKTDIHLNIVASTSGSLLLTNLKLK